LNSQEIAALPELAFLSLNNWFFVAKELVSQSGEIMDCNNATSAQIA
jgi:hypothetical protein